MVEFELEQVIEITCMTPRRILDLDSMILEEELEDLSLGLEVNQEARITNLVPPDLVLMNISQRLLMFLPMCLVVAL